MRKLIVSVAAALVAILAVAGLIWKKDSANAARAQAGAEIVLYSGEDFTGRSISITRTVYDMPVVVDPSGDKWDWNDNVRSLVVLGGTWRLYAQGRCNTVLDDTKLPDFDVRVKPAVEGWSTLVSATSTGPLEIRYPGAYGIGGDISSIELISGENLPDWSATLRK